MTNLELVLNMLAEASTAEISKEQKPKDLMANKKVAKEGGNVAKQARITLEKQTGKSVLSPKNATELQKPKRLLDQDKQAKS
jgi:lipopolysaccharide export system protein LptA